MNDFEKYIIDKTRGQYWDMIQFLMYFCDINSIEDIAHTPNLTIRQLTVFKLLIEKYYHLTRISE